MNIDQKTPINESLIWDAFRIGEAKAYEQIFRSNYSFLLNYGCNLNPNSDEVKDCLQSLFANLWERRAHLGKCNSIRSYLTASTRRIILKKLQENSHHIKVDLDSEHLKFHVVLSSEATMIVNEELQSKIDALQESIKSLPERQKEALYLKFYGDQSFADIAHAMDISNRAVYKLIYKALDNLGEQMKPVSTNLSTLLSIFF
jgi:RNA polymerase sigma factor (sigma-70 family)